MIEQRKIALISNRTCQSGGKRIPEAVIERDYCLSWFLIGLSHFPIAKDLIFKGGTALRRCYFPDYRFSEDLDFTLSKEMLLEDIFSAFADVFRYVKESSGIPFDIGSQEKPSLNTFTFTMTYEGPLPGKPREVKTDITFREKILRPVREKPILQSYPEYSDFEPDARVKVYSLEEVAIEKICALLSPARNEPRDLYDIWYLLENTELDLPHLVGDIETKIKFKDASLDELRSQFAKKEKRLAALWKNRLDAQMSVLSEFDEVYRVVKRALRQAGITEGK